ncbi:hypothetical protein [Baaleninema simplex]|nr:hypothetical protein [Baaleninema simplex]
MRDLKTGEVSCFTSQPVTHRLLSSHSTVSRYLPISSSSGWVRCATR